MNRTALKIIFLAMAGLMLLPVAASATWPGSNGKIYFSCRATGTGFSGQDICVINPDGSGFANLTNTPALTENTPAVSRDGSQVTFTRNTGAAYFGWVMNADGSNPHQVTPEEADGPAFTPGGQVSYRAKLTSTYEFRTVSAAGGGVSATLLAAGITGNVFAPRWTASGPYLYGKLAEVPPASGTYTQQIYTVGPGGEAPVTQPAAGLNSNQQPSWSPDGSKIVFWRTTGAGDDIWVISSSGGVDSKLTTSGVTVKESMPAYSPDGSKLVWDQYDTTIPANDFFHKKLVIANADGSGPVAIPTPAAIDYAATPVWAPVASAPLPPAPIASFDATGPKKVKKGKSVSVTLRCTGDTQCVVAYGATVTVPRKGKKAKTFKVKTKSVTMQAKSTKKITLKLPSSAKDPITKALKAGKKPSVKITATAKQPNNGPQIRKVSLKVQVTK
jgi:hypothetical protein